MAAYWCDELFQLVGSVVVVSAAVVTGACCLSSPRAWLWYRMALVSAASSSSVVGLTNNRCGRSKRINQMRAQVEVLEQQEQQLRGTEARIRDSVRDYLLPVLPRPLQMG
ncbi:hypothetical protein E8E15_010058 [Penicillium rubens]|nr:hypothetical protein E8E15_010058 [Penicillium rubens]